MTKQVLIISALLIIGIIGLPLSFVIMKNFGIDGFICGSVGGLWFLYFVSKANKYINENGIGRKAY